MKFYGLIDISQSIFWYAMHFIIYCLTRHPRKSVNGTIFDSKLLLFINNKPENPFQSYDLATKLKCKYKFTGCGSRIDPLYYIAMK